MLLLQLLLCIYVAVWNWTWFYGLVNCAITPTPRGIWPSSKSHTKSLLNFSENFQNVFWHFLINFLKKNNRSIRQVDQKYSPFGTHAFIDLILSHTSVYVYTNILMHIYVMWKRRKNLAQFQVVITCDSFKRLHVIEQSNYLSIIMQYHL